MLQRTVKISLCLLLHVSVQLDHPQGAYAEPLLKLQFCGIDQ
jgi:hypothetical protein